MVTVEVTSRSDLPKDDINEDVVVDVLDDKGHDEQCFGVEIENTRQLTVSEKSESVICRESTTGEEFKCKERRESELDEKGSDERD